MKSEFYKPFTFRTFVDFLISAVFITLAILAAIFIGNMIGKIISVICLGSFGLLFIYLGIDIIRLRMEVISHFIKEFNFTSSGAERKFIFLLEDNAKHLYIDVYKAITKFGAETFPMLLHYEYHLMNIIGIEFSFNLDTYKPNVFIAVNEHGVLMNKARTHQVAGYQDGNWLAVTYDERNPTLIPIVFHELGHLILSKAGFCGDHHAVILQAMGKLLPEESK